MVKAIRTIDLIDAIHHKVLDTIVIPKSWLGLCFGNDGKSLFCIGAGMITGF